MDSYIALFLAVAKPLLICLLVASALVGLLALVSPRAFALVVAKGNRWIDTGKFFRTPDNRFFRTLDKWVETDQFALRNARLTGFFVLVGTVILSYLYFVS